MTTPQIDWIAHRHHRRRDPRTSKDAAKSMEHAAAGICARILAALKDKPATASELATALGLNGYQVGKRTADLKNAGLIEPSGETRPGASGRAQMVWRLTK